jgi:uncharacterized membrane protein
MDQDRPVMSPAFRIASIAVLAAVTTVLTRLVQIPTPARGYLNLGDAVIVFTAITLGPLSAMFAGGLGTALADLLSPFAVWGPISLVVHGAQGLVVGLIARVRPGTLWLNIVGGVVGIVIMAGGYLAGGSLVAGFGASLADIPGNLIQGAVGVLLGILLAAAVVAAYPPVRNWKW